MGKTLQPTPDHMIELRLLTNCKKKNGDFKMIENKFLSKDIETLVTFAVETAIAKMDATQLRTLVTDAYGAVR
jgi:hypothetical protein